VNFLRSLQGRIFLSSALLAVLSIGATVWVVRARLRSDAERSLEREMTAAVALVDQLRVRSAQTFTLMARLIADAPKLKAAVDTNDPPTVQDVANGYQRELNSALLLVTNASGDVLARVGAETRTALVMANQPAVRNAAAGHEGFSLLPQADGVLQLVTVPISIGLNAPQVLGTLSVGFLLDDALAAQLKQITGSEIAFGVDGQVLASTLPAARQELSALLRRADRSGRATIAGEEFNALPLPLSAAGDLNEPGTGPVALILRSRSEQLRLLAALNTQLALMTAAAIGLATVFSFGVARTITRPLAAITDVMRQAAATGDLTRKIALPPARGWEDEDARLLAATFNGLTDSVTAFQRAFAQRERLAALGRLSTVIAHEVRNPLMIIKAALHDLRRPDLAPERLREAAADIDGEVTRLNRIVADVLDFARPITVEMRPTDLNALCRESAAAAQAGAGCIVALDLAPALPTVITDPDRLRSALVNLLVNARQAAEARPNEGSPTPMPPSVTLSTRAQDRSIQIVVADNGLGIPAPDVARAFEPFFTTKRGGTGLGLPITKNIIDGLGGTLVAVSHVGVGTTMRVELPCAPHAPNETITS
jgi:signal transduction histidine kinase